MFPLRFWRLSSTTAGRDKVRSRVTWRVLQIAAIALVAVSFLKTVQHYRESVAAELVNSGQQLCGATKPGYLH